MGSCLSVARLFSDMRRAQREAQSTRVIVNFMVGRGPSFTGPLFTISTRQNEPKEKEKENEEVEMKAMKHWAEKVKPTAQFLDVEDTSEFPCVICGEDTLELKCDNKITEFLEKVNKKLPQGINGCVIKPDLSVDMGCCCQTVHVGCLLTW